jgi:hypothetical protein
LWHSQFWAQEGLFTSFKSWTNSADLTAVGSTLQSTAGYWELSFAMR